MIKVDTERWDNCWKKYTEASERLRRVIEGFSIGDIPSDNRTQALSDLRSVSEVIHDVFRLRKEEARHELIRHTIASIDTP